MKTIRLMNLEQYILQNKMASYEKLAEVFNVSVNTIRRDVAELVEKGVVKKIHGGVSVNFPQEETTSFQMRSVKNPEAKNKIGKLAADLINDGDVIFIDSGTTTLQLFPYIKDKHVTLLTNNLNIISLAISAPSLEIICTGGKLYRTTNSFIGIQAIKSVRSFNIHKAFMAATGVSLHRGCTNSSSLEYELKRSVVEKSEKVFLMVDHSKYDVVSLMTFCDLSALSGFITDQEPPDKYKSYFNSHQIACIY